MTRIKSTEKELLEKIEKLDKKVETAERMFVC